jgi:hypothetical protein
LVRLHADDAVALGYRGHARLKSGDRVGAKADFRRAVALLPSYEFGRMHLFDMELADGEVEAAARTLEQLKVHSSGPFVDSREVELAARRENRKAAVTALERLCVSEANQSDWPLRTADRTFAAAGWARHARAVYSKALEKPGVNPLVGTLWVERSTAIHHRWQVARRLGALLNKGDVGQRVAVAYLTALGRARASWPTRRAVRRHRGPFRADGQCWGSVGYALTSTGRHRDAVKWLADWPQRAGVQPWMLLNLVLSLRALGRDEEASSAGLRASELAEDATIAKHKIWLALDDVLSGRAEEAAKRLDGIDASGFQTIYRYLFGLATILLDLARACPDARQQMRKLKRRELASLGRSHAMTPADFDFVRHTYHRALRMIAAYHGRIFGAFWTLWRRARPPRKSR